MHPRIAAPVAEALGVASRRRVLLAASADCLALGLAGAGGAVEAFGQSEALTTRLRHIIQVLPVLTGSHACVLPAIQRCQSCLHHCLQGVKEALLRTPAMRMHLCLAQTDICCRAAVWAQQPCHCGRANPCHLVSTAACRRTTLRALVCCWSWCRMLMMQVPPRRPSCWTCGSMPHPASWGLAWLHGRAPHCWHTTTPSSAQVCCHAFTVKHI